MFGWSLGRFRPSSHPRSLTEQQFPDRTAILSRRSWCLVRGGHTRVWWPSWCGKFAFGSRNIGQKIRNDYLAACRRARRAKSASVGNRKFRFILAWKFRLLRNIILWCIVHKGTQRYSLSDFCTVFLQPWASFTHHDGHHTRVRPPRTKHQLLRLRIAVRSGNCCSVRDRGCDDGRNLPSDQPNTYTKSLSTISLCNMDLEPNNHALQLREIWGGAFFLATVRNLTTFDFLKHWIIDWADFWFPYRLSYRLEIGDWNYRS